MACIYKFDNKDFNTIDEIVNYISDNKLDVSKLLASVDVVNPVSTPSQNNDIFEEIKQAHYGDFIYQTSKFFEKEGLTTPNNDVNFVETIRKIAKDKGLNSIAVGALITRIKGNIFENRIVDGKTGIQELIDYINEKFNLNIKLDSSDYEKLSNELKKSEFNIITNVMSNDSLSNTEKIKKANDNTLLRNKWIKETTKILNTILSQVDPSIPKLEPEKATKENTASISDFDRKDILDNFVTNLKNKNKDSHERVMAVLDKYGISFDDFIKDIEAYYKGTKTATPKITTAPTTQTQTTSQYKIVELKVPNDNGHKFAINNNGLTVSFFTKEKAEEWIKNKEKENQSAVVTPVDTLSALKNDSNNAVDDGSTPFDPGQYRVYFEKTIQEKENIEEFKKWLSSVLPQISVEVSDKLIDNKAFGSFINGVIRLYEGAEKGTGYHEAFEAVWNSYLTPEQKKQLVEEYKQRKDYKKLPEYIWANTNYPESSENNKIKEALAEEFISYVRDGGKTTIVNNSPVRNTIFRKILNLIKKLWDHIQEAFGLTNVKNNDLSINNLFKQIVDAQFANKIAINTEIEPQYRSTINNTSVEFTHNLMEGMTSYFFSIMYNPKLNNGLNVKSLFDKNKPQLFDDIYSKVDAYIGNDFGLEYKRIKENYIANTGATDIQADAHMATIPEFQYRNTARLNFNTEVKQKFKLYLSQFGIKFKEIKEKNDDEELNEILSKESTSTDRLGIKDAIYVDPRSMTKTEVKLLIASIAAYNYETDTTNIIAKRNKLGLPSLEDYGKKINMLLNEFTKIVPLKYYDSKSKTIVEYPVIDQMFDKLDKKYKINGKYKKGYEWIKNLKYRLGYSEINESLKEISSLNEDEISLRIAFETSFTTNRNSPYKLIVGDNNTIFADNTLDNVNSKRIREKWENNIKSFASTFTYVNKQDLYNAPMVYISDEGIISINNLSKEFQDMAPSSSLTMVDIINNLKKLGIEFSEDYESLNSVEFDKAYRNLYNFIANGKIKTFDDLFSRQNINSTINYFTNIEAALTADDTILSVRNAEGKQQYSITQTSAITNIINSFNSSRTLTDFIASNPHIGKVDLETGEVILFPYVQNSLILTKGGRFFNKKGERIKDIDYRYILGMSNQTESIGDSTDSLQFPDKITQEIYHLLDGTYYTIINSDKSSEFGLNLGRFINFDDTKSDLNNNDYVLDLYKNALTDEINVAIYERNNSAINPKIKEYSKNVEKLGHFENILKLKDNSALNKKYEKVLNGQMSVEEFVNLPEIKPLIVNYLNNKVTQTKNWFIKNGIVKKKDSLNYKSDSFSKEQLDEFGIKPEMFNNNDLENIIKYLMINRQLGVFEQHKLIYGHPQLYKDLAKRSSGANSQTQAISENPFYLEWLDENRKRYDGLEKRTDTFRYTSYNDPEVTSLYYKQLAEEIYKGMISPFVNNGGVLPESFKKEFERIIGAEFDSEGNLKSISAGKNTYMNAYISMTENDGGSYIMPDFFRDLHFLSGKENKDQVALLDYENALEILDRSNPEHPMYSVPGFAKSYDKTIIENARKIKELGKPKGVVLQVLKPYGFGYNKTDARRTHTSLLKNSVVPLTWSRVIDRPNMLGKYLDAQAKHIDIIAFEGSQKVGFVLEDNGVKVQNLYDQNGHINRNANPIQEMYTKYFGFQVEMASYTKDKVIFGSQMRKINLSNLPEELHDVAIEYNNLLNALTEIEFTKLLKDLGLKKVDDTYETENLKTMLDFLRSEIEKRDLPENLMAVLDYELNSLDNQNIKYRFDASPIRDKFNSIINALIDNRILAQEMNGKASVQIPATMFESKDRKFTYLKDGLWQDAISGEEIQKLDKEERKSARIVSSDLQFYKKELKNGKEVVSSMEVYVPWMFKNIDPEKAGFIKENGIWIPKNKEVMESLLKSIGFRIPTQGMNSIDSIIIKGFLPEDWGDSVIVPSEIVGKAGSDFDIDKLNMFFKNYYVKNDKLVEVEYDADPANTKKRYNNYINKKYSNILSPLKAALSKIKEESKTNIKEINDLSKDIDIAEELLRDNNEKQSKLLADLFNFKIRTFSDLLKADENLKSLTYEGEYLYDMFVKSLDNYNNTLDEIQSIDTFDNFSKLPIEQQNSKEALQNRVIDLISQILTHPKNFKQLTTPNSTSTVKPLAEKIRNIKGLKDNEADKTALSEWDSMANIREAYLTGKKLVGIIALQITSHSLSQYGDIELSGTYLDENGDERNIVINVDHTSEQGKFILNLIHDKNYQVISELLSESMNGSVDAAKDPFIFDLNLTINTASTWFYLQKLGVPIKDLAYLHNQPSIIDYYETVNKNKSVVNKANNFQPSNKDTKFMALTPYLFKAYPSLSDEYTSSDYMLSLFEMSGDQVSLDRRKLLRKYRKTIKNIINSIYIEPLTTKSLESSLKTFDKLSSEEAKNQIAILRDYLEYTRQANMFSDFIRSISYDTVRNKSILENKLQKNLYEKVKKSKFVVPTSLEKLINTTFLKNIKSVKDDVEEMFKDHFVSLHPKSKPFFNYVMDIISDVDTFMTDDERKILLNRFENFFLTYLTHVVKIKMEANEFSQNTFYKSMFIGNDSIPLQLKKFQKIYPDNKALATLFGIINSDIKETDNIKIYNTSMDTYEVNTFGESLVELYNFAVRNENDELRKFVKKLGIFSILQSGVQQSPISYNRILPVELYSSIVGTIFDNFIANNDIMFSPELVWKQFNQNNYSNSKLIKILFDNQRSFDQIPVDVITITDRFGNVIKDDYVVKKYIKKELIGKKEKIQELKKNKKWNEIYDTVLYQRIKEYNSDDKEIGEELEDSYYKFRPVNPLGNGMYLTEVYDQDEVKSVLDRNNVIDESLYNEAVKAHKQEMFNVYVKKQLNNKNDENSEVIYSKLGDETQSPNVVISNIKTKDDKYDRDANIKEAQNNNRIYSMETSSDLSFSNPWAHFNRTGTIKTATTKEAVKNYIDWLTTDKFKDVKPERKEWILAQLKSGELKNKPIQYYAELNEPSHATALDYLINRYNWNQPTAQQTPLPPVSSTPTIPSDGKSRPVFDSLPSKSATPTMTYAGIGSRETPQKVLDLMTEAAKYLEGIGYTLNTGKTFTAKPSSDPKYQAQYEERLAFSKKHNGKVGLDEEGADRAFSLGATKKNLFGVDKPVGQREMAVMQEIHPNPSALKEGAKKLMARNTNQVFGENLDTPVDFVLFYAQETKGIRPEGGTGQAVEMARRKGIPTINMADANWKDQLKAVITKAPTEEKSVKNEKVLEGDIFALPGIPVITTNLGGVHGAGLAQLAKAKGLIKQGDGGFKANDEVVQLPVKKVWSDNMSMNNNMELLKESLKSLIKVARENEDKTYLLPLAGLGHGEGSIEEILPLLIKTIQSEDNIKLVLPAENIDLGRQGTTRKDYTRKNMPKIKTMLSKAGLLNNEINDENSKVNYALNEPVITFDELTEFTNQRKQEIITNFAIKHQMSEETALNYINEAIQKQGKKEIINTLNKTDEFGNKCY